MKIRSEIRIIHVKLLDEPVPVWRPVEARQTGADQYVILDQDIPDFEVWEFLPGQQVLTEKAISDGETYIRAKSLLDHGNRPIV